MDNDDVGFWDPSKASRSAEIFLSSLARVSPIIAGKSLKLLSWQDNRYSARMLSPPPLFNAREKEEFKCINEVFWTSQRREQLYMYQHMCAEDRYYFHLLQFALHFIYWQGVSLNPEHTDLVSLPHHLALGIDCLYLLTARITDRSPNPYRFY